MIMFTSADFSLIRRKCLPNLENLLNLMEIPIPNWSSNDEFKLYAKLDDDITKKLCQLMKSLSIVDGYSYLLKLGNIEYDFTDTNKDLLNKIVNNASKIIYGCRSSVNVQPIQHTQYEKVEQVNVEFSQARKPDISKLYQVLTKAKEAANYLDSFRMTSPRFQASKDFAKNVLKSLNALFSYKSTPTEFDSREINVNKLVEITGEKENYNLDGFIEEIKYISKNLPVGDNINIHINISKDMVNQKKIIFEPPRKPLLDAQEVEHILKILEQVNNIKKSI